MRNTKNIKSASITILLFVILSARIMISAEDDSKSNLIKMNEQNLKVMERTDFHGYVGFVTSGTYLGISANIGLPGRFPDVQDSGESVWVSTSKNSSGEWLQAGTRYYDGYTSFVKYVEYFDGGIYKILTNFGTQDLGSYVNYKVEYNTNDGKWHAYVNGQDCAASRFSPSQIQVQANAEIHKEGIQMGPFRFENVKLKNPSAVWIDNNTMPNYYMPGYSFAGIETMFSVWGPE